VLGRRGSVTDEVFGRDTYNVAERHPEVVRELRDRLEGWRNAFRENPRGWR
jgi:hypothetical protein